MFRLFSKQFDQQPALLGDLVSESGVYIYTYIDRRWEGGRIRQERRSMCQEQPSQPAHPKVYECLFPRESRSNGKRTTFRGLECDHNRNTLPTIPG